MAKAVIVQASFNSGELSPYMEVRVDQSRYATGCRILHNMLVKAHGSAYRRPGMQFLGEALDFEADKKIRLIPFVFNEEQTYMLEFADKVIRVWHKDGLIIDEEEQVLLIETEYEHTLLHTLRVCQSADVLYLVSPYYPPHKLERHSHLDWRLVTIDFAPKQDAPVLAPPVVTGAGGRNYAYVVTAINDDTDEESLPSEAVNCVAAPALTTASYVSLAWESLEGVREYRIYRGDAGVGNYGYIGRSTGKTYVDRGQGADHSQGLPQPREVFSKEKEYPSIVQFYQQRLCFASSFNAPQTVWSSVTGNFQNMCVSYPLRSDDACTATIASDKVSFIRWMVGSKSLLLGTSDGEWSMMGNAGEALAPDSCQIERHGAYGAEDLPALSVGDTILFVQRGGAVVREFRYTLDTDGYLSSNLSLLAEHMFEQKKIVDWAWQQNPHMVLWCVLSDGTLAAMTFIREHEVVAWHRHSTDGFIEGIASIPSPKQDEVWFIVRRMCKDAITGESISIRTIEKLAPVFEEDAIANAYFVDSGLTWRGKPVTRLSHLYHLEGKQVDILVDGYVHPPQMVRDGSITLERPGSIIHIGLGFISDIAPIVSEPAELQGAGLGMQKRIGRVRFKLYRSLGCQVGPHANALRDVIFRPVQLPLGQALGVFTGDCNVLIDSTLSTSGGVYFRQSDPLPFTLLAMTYELEIGDAS